MKIVGGLTGALAILVLILLPIDFIRYRWKKAEGRQTLKQQKATRKKVRTNDLNTKRPFMGSPYPTQNGANILPPFADTPDLAIRNVLAETDSLPRGLSNSDGTPMKAKRGKKKKRKKKRTTERDGLIENSRKRFSPGRVSPQQNEIPRNDVTSQMSSPSIPPHTSGSSESRNSRETRDSRDTNVSISSSNRNREFVYRSVDEALESNYFINRQGLNSHTSRESRFSREPTLSVLSGSRSRENLYQSTDAGIQNIYSIDHHRLDTMSPTETGLYQLEPESTGPYRLEDGDYRDYVV